MFAQSDFPSGNDTIIKRNANAFSLNAVVNVRLRLGRRRRRRRRHGMIFFIISKLLDFKINRKVALDSLYISAGNDVINYFRSVANRINVFIFGSYSGRDFSIIIRPIPKMFTVLETVIQGLRSLFCNLLDSCAI